MWVIFWYIYTKHFFSRKCVVSVSKINAFHWRKCTKTTVRMIIYSLHLLQVFQNCENALANAKMRKKWSFLSNMSQERMDASMSSIFIYDALTQCIIQITANATLFWKLWPSKQIRFSTPAHPGNVRAPGSDSNNFVPSSEKAIWSSSTAPTFLQRNNKRLKTHCPIFDAGTSLAAVVINEWCVLI